MSGDGGEEMSFAMRCFNYGYAAYVLNDEDIVPEGPDIPDRPWDPDDDDDEERAQG